MTSIEKTGTSIEAIIAAFRGEHRIRDWELNYKIVKKPSKGLFGLFGRKQAVVRFELPSLGERAGNLLSQLLGKMGIPFSRVTTKTEGKSIHLEIKDSQDTGLLIGKNGYMLETLQYFVNRVFENEHDIDRIYIDVDGYRERREAQFLKKFQPIMKKVREQGKPQTLEPMSSTDRRIIHRYVERERGLRTLTIGEGEQKRIVIFSARQKESEALSQAQDSKDKKPRSLRRERGGRPKLNTRPEHSLKREQNLKPEQNPKPGQRPRPNRRPRPKGKTSAKA
ncbi:MAG TPA: Jag N-terminal domain-containing protein [Candidatus Syntrophosphaera sp.]|jgi:spoIIIJ-associated protein|nr:Jag N-terminal domain-containing protein [Candidatus Syntrophosphaera sp.]HPK83330.1 Jag N-terminal domain-containing protein [Candidatus Syntrophosphaera sp.]HQG94846.1 Jag N-terminal domain-containing protein [Candidatus Syntrophosphaera sp.]HQK29795.1 Jag N-terminal domain-containing protein [Candidatus Syntrophosphaera sp.]HRT60169.1 Jag N-terminal domain-containing protein [Candidatus Syntrophosphaera sp.]